MGFRSMARLRELCIEKNWFDNGTNFQYDKLFTRAREGATIEEVAIIIWTCSEDVEQAEIIKELKEIWGE